MADLDVVLTEIQALKRTQDKHTTSLERLADAYTKMAVQSEQIASLQAQCALLFNKYDALTGTEGPITKIRDHQGQCPRDEMHRMFRWMWAALGIEAMALLTIAAQLVRVTP